MGRAKRKSMRWQAEQALLSKLCIGESRHTAKEKAKEEGKKTSDGIYSWSTYNSYKKHCIRFVEWAKVEKGCKTIEAAKDINVKLRIVAFIAYFYVPLKYDVFLLP